MSRAGSQVMKTGRRDGRVVDGGDAGVRDVGRAGDCGGSVVDGDEAEGGLLTRSIMRAILSSSSGQMSGQCVNPK